MRQHITEQTKLSMTQSTIQSINPNQPNNQVNQPTTNQTESIIQPTTNRNQSINQTIAPNQNKQPIMQFKDSTNHSNNQTINEPIKQPSTQQTNQANNQPSIQLKESNQTQSFK